MLETRVRIGGETICFKKEATQWMAIWLDSKLNFNFYVNKRLKKAKTAEAQIKSLNKTYGFCLELVRRIKVVGVQFIALYRAKLWWKGQKNHVQELQKWINCQT